MTSFYVTHHVTIVTCLFIIQEIKETKNKRKREIKLKKIDKIQLYSIKQNLMGVQ